MTNLSVIKISRELIDVFQFPFTRKVPYTRGRTDLILVEMAGDTYLLNTTLCRVIDVICRTIINLKCYERSV